MSSTICCGVKNWVRLHCGVTGKLADGVPQDEMSIAEEFLFSESGTSALYVRHPHYIGTPASPTDRRGSLTLQNHI